MQISATIVTYKNSHEMLNKAISSFLNTEMDVKLYIVDNSPTDEIKTLCNDSRIEYIFNNANVGFGKAHNVIMKSSYKIGKYHIVLNPDVYFNKGVLEGLYSYMEDNFDVGLVMPKVYFPDGRVQYLCKLLPTPYDFFGRRFLKYFSFADKHDAKFELRFTNYDKPMNVPYLSGCFMFLRSEILPVIGYFDERIFMYIEDTDLSRRIHDKYRTMFYPNVCIYHHWGKGNHKSLKLLKHSINGAFVYFNKYGWLFDKTRREINSKLLKDLNYKKL